MPERKENVKKKSKCRCTKNNLTYPLSTISHDYTNICNDCRTKKNCSRCKRKKYEKQIKKDFWKDLENKFNLSSSSSSFEHFLKKQKNIRSFNKNSDPSLNSNTSIESMKYRNINKKLKEYFHSNTLNKIKKIKKEEKRKLFKIQRMQEKEKQKLKKLQKRVLKKEITLEETSSDKSWSTKKCPSESSGVSNYKLRHDNKKRNKFRKRSAKRSKKVKTLQPLLIVQKNDGEKINLKKLMKKVRLVLKNNPKKLEPQNFHESQSD